MESPCHSRSNGVRHVVADPVGLLSAPLEHGESNVIGYPDARPLDQRPCRTAEGSATVLAALRSVQGREESVEGMGCGWEPKEGKLDLKGELRTEWPAAEIARVGPENIFVLDLSKNRLTGIPGAELAKLTNLERLFLSGNLLTALPLEIGRLAALSWLDVSNNQLTALPPEIGCLATLHQLVASRNHLMSLPSETGALAALEVLNVSHNRLTSLPPEIGRLDALQSLGVTDNQLTSLPPEIGRLAALRLLYAHGNPVVDSWPEPVRCAVNDNSDVSCRDASAVSGKAQLAAVVPYLRSLLAPEAAPATDAPHAPSPPAPTSGEPSRGTWNQRNGKLDLQKTGQTNWPSGRIARFGSKNIQELDLGGNKLARIPGAELAKLTNLKKLWLSGNQLTSLPSEIGALAALQELHVEGNQLTALPPEIGLLCLQKLDASNNQLTALPPDINRLFALQQLNASRNQLTTLPSEIGHLAVLRGLDVSGNQLTALPSEIGRLDALVTLSVHNNPVVDSWPELIRRAVNDNEGDGQAQLAAVVPYLRSLPAPTAAPATNAPHAPIPPAPASGTDRRWKAEQGILYLRREGRTEWPAVEIARAGPENIRELDLGGNKLTRIPGAELAKLTNLEKLELSGNQLTSLPPEIGHLAALKFLNVTNNQLAALPPEIARLATLQTLNLSWNKLTALPPEIGHLAALRKLDSTFNQLTTLPPEIGLLAALEELQLRCNKLTSLPPEIGRLAALKSLYVDGNQLAVVPPEIGRLPALQCLLVHSNPVVDLSTSSWPDSIRNFVSLDCNSNSYDDQTAYDSGKVQCAAVVPYLRSLLAPEAAPAARAAEPPPPLPPHAALRPAAPASGPCTASVFPAASAPAKFDVFLSHERDTAGPLARALTVHLEQARPGLRVFLDAGEPRPELHRIHEIIDASASVVLIISKDVLKSSSVLGEVRHAIGAGKNIVLLHDEASCPFPAAAEIPEDLKPALSRAAIPYPLQNKRKAASIEALLEQCAAALRLFARVLSSHPFIFIMRWEKAQTRTVEGFAQDGLPVAGGMGDYRWLRGEIEQAVGRGRAALGGFSMEAAGKSFGETRRAARAPPATATPIITSSSSQEKQTLWKQVPTRVNK
eukprot:tig00000042_g15428.t1